MTPDLRATVASRAQGDALRPAQDRAGATAPAISATRSSILDELDRKAGESSHYTDWPERVPGVPIGFMPGHAGPLCYDLDTHRLVLGRSGGGKGTAAICPLLLHDDGHAVVMLDPKSGSIARATAGYRQRLGPVHIIDPYNKTRFFDESPCAHFNPLAVLDPDSKTLVEDAANLAAALCYLPEGGGDDNTFWDRSARLFTTALILHLVTTSGEDARLLRLWSLLTLPGDEFLANVVLPMQGSRACDGTVARLGNAMAQHALSNMRSFSDVLATIRLSWIEFQGLRAVSQTSTFDFADVRAQGGTVYIVMDDDRFDVCASWVRLMLQSARLGLKAAASQRPVHFVIDEAAVLGKLDLITTGLRAWREARIRLHLFYQDIGQIKSAFRDGWGSVANTDVLQFMGCNPLDYETAEHISKVLGERDMIVPTEGDGTSTTTGTSRSAARGETISDTAGASFSEARSHSHTVGSSWSSTVGGSHTVGRSVGAGGATTSNESWTHSWSDSVGGSSSSAAGRSTTEGQTSSRSEGRSRTDTSGTSRSDAVSTNRSFTLQLRRSMRPEEVRMLPADQMVVIAGNREPALVHKEHFYRNPRLVARALIPFDPTTPGPIGTKRPPAADGLISGLVALVADAIRRR